MKSKEFDIKEIIKNAVENADHLFCDEQDFRIAVVEEIKKVFKKRNVLVITEYKYYEEKKTKKSINPKIDIFVFIDQKRYAIELKYRPSINKGDIARKGKINLIEKGIIIDWEIKKLGNLQKHGIYGNSDKEGMVVAWKKGNAKNHYYISAQTTSKKCAEDVEKMLNFVSNYDNGCIAYSVVLTNHNDEYINEIDNNVNKILVPNKVTPEKLDLLEIEDGPHKAYKVNIYKIKKK